MSAHTPGPWLTVTGKKTGRVMVRGSDGSLVCTIADATPGYPVTAADAERIVACVNYCEGAETETLRRTSYAGIHNTAEAFAANLKKTMAERDELLAALRAAMAWRVPTTYPEPEWVAAATAAIAKAEGRHD